jgi:prevent-host-death family protein
MAELAVRELHRNAAAALDRVKRGESLDITEHGAVVARLIPAADTGVIPSADDQDTDHSRYLVPHPRGAERC